MIPFINGGKVLIPIKFNGPCRGLTNGSFFLWPKGLQSYCDHTLHVAMVSTWSALLPLVLL